MKTTDEYIRYEIPLNYEKKYNTFYYSHYKKYGEGTIRHFICGGANYLEIYSGLDELYEGERIYNNVNVVFC